MFGNCSEDSFLALGQLKTVDVLCEVDVPITTLDVIRDLDIRQLSILSIAPTAKVRLDTVGRPK